MWTVNSSWPAAAHRVIPKVHVTRMASNKTIPRIVPKMILSPLSLLPVDDLRILPKYGLGPRPTPTMVRRRLSMSLEHPMQVVLCIDDNEDVLQVLETLLHDKGYKVLTASSGAHGLELAALGAVDVVVLDYEMPGLNGHDVAVALRQHEPHIPIVMFSGAIDIPRRTLDLVDTVVSKGDLYGFSQIAHFLESLPLMSTPALSG